MGYAKLLLLFMKNIMKRYGTCETITIVE